MKPRAVKPKAAPTSEADIQRLVMIELSAAGHFVERVQSGLLYTKDARPVRIGFPGRSDLSGFRAGDARAFFFEIKNAHGVATKEQKQFIAAMLKRGAIAGIVRSVEDALKLISE